MATFTKEDAKAMSILDVAQSLGMEMKQDSSQEWYWVEHNSFKINTRKNRFNWYSREIYGDVINLVETIKEVDYTQAMHFLRTGEFPKAEMTQQVKEPFRYILGRFEQPFVEARAYLKDIRGLSDDTINFFGQAGVLAQANKKAADDYLEPVVVFKSLDKDKQVIGASLQGIVPNRERYEGKGYLKQIAYNSDGLSGMSVDIGTPKRLVFAEAPIDLMSYYEANKGNLSDVRLVAMDGLKAGTVSRYTMELLAELKGKTDYKPDLNKVGGALEKLVKVTTFFQDGENGDLITLAVDNDKAGRDFIERLQEKGIPVQTDIPPLPAGTTKMDWNDYLKSQKAGVVLEDNIPRDNSHLDNVPSNIQANEKVQELLGQVEEMGQSAYFWVTEEDLEQPKEIVSQLDNWFASEKVDSTYKSDLFELVAGDYTYMIEFRDGSISLQNMEDYSQYISNRIDEFGVDIVISELESVIHDFNQVKNSITEGMNKELDALTSELTRDTELLDKQTTTNNEKEQDMELEHEMGTLVQTTEPRFELEFSELGRPEHPITNLDELQTWLLHQFNYRSIGEGYFKTYLQVYSVDEQGQEIASQIRFDVGHGQKDFNPRRENIRDYLVDNGYIQLNSARLETEATLAPSNNQYQVRFNWAENLGDSPNALKDFSEGDLIPYAEFISVLYTRNEYNADRGGFEKVSFDIISPDGEVLVSDLRYDAGTESQSIAEKLEDRELLHIEEANKEPYKLLAAIDKHLEIPAHFSLPESAIDVISTQYGENTPVLSESEEKMLDWLEQHYPPTDEYALELQRGFGVAGLKSTLNHNTWEQYVSNSPLSEAELTEEVNQRTERFIQVRNEIKERLQSEFVPTLLQEIQKTPEQTQEQTKKERTNFSQGSLQLEAEGSTAPVLETSTFERSVTSRPTISSRLLHFNIAGGFKSTRNSRSHSVVERELNRLNSRSHILQNAAQYYIDELANSTISYFTADGSVIQIKFLEENFMHLTGIEPIKEGQTAQKTLHDFANGYGEFDDILVAHQGAAFEKISVLPDLEVLFTTGAFYFSNLENIDRYQGKFDSLVKADEKEIMLLFRFINENEGVPTSIFKAKTKHIVELQEADKNQILGIYRERNGVIEELDINKNYVKDGGKEFLTILQNRQVEPILSQEEPTLQERFTSVFDGVKEMGYGLFKDRKEEEFLVFHQLYEQNHKDLNQTVLAALKQELVDTNSNFFSEWKDDFLYQEKGISSVDVLNGKLTREEYEAQVSSLIEEKLKPQQSLSELLESNDNQALFSHLKEGMKEYVNSDKYKQFLIAMSKFHDYSITNIHLMLAQNPNITQVASYQKWRTDFDRQVQRGEKGIKIWVPMTFKAKDQNGQPILDEDGKEKTVTRFKLGSVFDVSQTAGKELPKPVYNLESDVPDYQNIYRAARHVSHGNGVNISFQPIDSGANGYYHIKKNEIVIADKKMSEAQILKTLFHEMAHSELHHYDDGYSSSERELQAESIAYVVANHFGIDTSEYSFGYLHNWSRDKQGYEDLENQLKVVQAESKSLINRIDKSLELIKNKTLTTNKLQSKIAQAKQKQEQQKQLKSSEVKQEKSKKQQPIPKGL